MGKRKSRGSSTLMDEDNTTQYEIFKIPFAQGISEDQLLNLEQEVQKTWCAMPHEEQTTYSMIWHEMLPHVHRALARSLHPLSPDDDAYATVEQGEIYMF